MNITAFHITEHACERFCERVRGQRPTFRSKGKAMRAIAARLASAELLEACGWHDGTWQRAWALADCVAMEKRGSITTILTFDMYERGIRDDSQGAA